MRRIVIATAILSLLLVPTGATTAEQEAPAAGTFSPAGSLTEAGGLNAAAPLPDGRVFVLGGGFDFASAAEVWDPATNRFSPAAWLTGTHLGIRDGPS